MCSSDLQHRTSKLQRSSLKRGMFQNLTPGFYRSSKSVAITSLEEASLRLLRSCQPGSKDRRHGTPCLTPFKFLHPHTDLLSKRRRRANLAAAPQQGTVFLEESDGAGVAHRAGSGNALFEQRQRLIAQQFGVRLHFAVTVDPGAGVEEGV